MKRYLYIYIIAAISFIATSCSAYTHKELCETHREHAHRYHVEVVADYRYDWEENFIPGDPQNRTTWQIDWPSHYLDYESLRPTKPSGLRVINYGESGNYNVHNIPASGGIVDLYEGYNDILFYNNDTEYIVFSRNDNGVTTRATTRTRTRASYNGNIFANEGEKEPTVNAPDMLFANYFEDYYAEKVLEPVKLPVTLQPLVFTYKIRYEFAEGLKYVALAQGALSGMAESVLLNTGETSENTATILYDCEVTDYGVRAIVRSFGAPAFPNMNYPTRTENKHGLDLTVMLRNGKTISFQFDVTDQVAKQPHGGVIVVKGIVIEEDMGMQGTGSFDVEVDDWGPYEDIELPL